METMTTLSSFFVGNILAEINYSTLFLALVFLLLVIIKILQENREDNDNSKVKCKYFSNQSSIKFLSRFKIIDL